MKFKVGVNVMVPALKLTVPFTAPCTLVTVNPAFNGGVRLSGSVSFAKRVLAVITAAVSSAVVAVSLTATGAVLTPPTSIVTVASADVSPPSVAR